MALIRILAILVGIIFIIVGVAGYIPNFVTNGNLLLGIFEVDSMHNSIHILSGIIALLCSFSVTSSRLYFQIFGIIYAIVAIAGFITGGQLLMMQMNLADNILHVVIALVFLYIGFLMNRTETR